jgi:hypothetical protein
MMPAVGQMRTFREIREAAVPDALMRNVVCFLLRVAHIMFHKLLLYLLALLTGAYFLASDAQANDIRKQTEKRKEYGRLQLSPDGSKIIFRWGIAGGVTTALMDWRTGKVTVIPLAPFATANPEIPRSGIYDASYTPDGEHLIGLVFSPLSANGRTLVKVKLDTMEYTQLYELPQYDPSNTKVRYRWHEPRQQPGTNKVLFVVNHEISVYKPSLILLDPQTGKMETVLDSKNGFDYGIFGLGFASKDEVVVGGRKPLSPDLLDEVRKLEWKDADIRSYPYAISLATGRARPVASVPNQGGFIGVSNDGRTIGLNALSRLKPYTDSGAYNYEIFSLTNGNLKQHTFRFSYITNAVMSSDGSTVVFQTAPNNVHPGGSTLDLYAADLRTDQVTRIPFFDYLQQYQLQATKQ